MLRSKIETLQTHSAYNVLCDRLEAETDAILAGAGDEENWIQIYNQTLTLEKEILGV